MSSAVTSAPLALMIGDPNGIGPEIALKTALAVAARPGSPAPLLVGDAYIVEACAEMLGLDAAQRGLYRVHDVSALPRADWQPGTISSAAGAATVAYVREAVSLAERGVVRAIAAAPHCETAINAAGIPFSGYSGLVADLTGTPRDKVSLMLEAAGLRVAHVTVHERLIDAVSRLTPHLVVETALAAHATLQRLGFPDPTICLLGINPHAGEDGLFGREDEDITRPAVYELRSRGIQAIGPIGADLALAERRYDAYIAMYHDQGHIAVKMLSPKGATALVAGAPVLFASVGHGSAFDIAGKGCADASALIATATMLAQIPA